MYVQPHHGAIHIAAAEVLQTGMFIGPDRRPKSTKNFAPQKKAERPRPSPSYFPSDDLARETTFLKQVEARMDPAQLLNQFYSFKQGDGQEIRSGVAQGPP